MWAWLATLGKSDGTMDGRTIQSLPRELSLPADGILRIKTLRELETLRYAPVTLSDITIGELTFADGISTLVLPENVTLTANQIIQVQLNAK
jgi:hypothetical protein